MTDDTTFEGAANGDAASPAGPETVTVRMYRGLLGDCFLLTHALGERRFRVLFDCGVLQAIGNGKDATVAGVAHIGSVVENLLEDTGGVIDVMIATHEHYDHLSGFILHFDVWSQFTIRALWLAWTENYADPLANDIRLGRSKGLAALSALVATATSGETQPFGLAADDPALVQSVASIRDLLQFYGEIEPDPTPGSGHALVAATAAVDASNPRPMGRPPKVPPRSCQDVLDWLKSVVPAANVRYLEPGQQVMLGLDDRLKASVLGPPKLRSRLLQLDPSSGPAREVYLVQPGQTNALVTTLQLAGGGGTTAAAEAEGNYPFAARFRRSREGVASDPLAVLYYEDTPDNAKRRIDGEWLGSAETLALKIDGDVNNTSLALAIEVPGRDVFLFPADAQVGNWLSWHDQPYPAKPTLPGAQQESAQDILNRVVFYKVGHHASHNATAREQGLEMMLSPDLVAMIPVVEAVAREQQTRNNPDGWAMPYGDLYTRLQEKTRRRIIRGDGDVTTERAAFQAAGGRFVPRYADAGAAPLWAELSLECGAGS